MIRSVQSPDTQLGLEIARCAERAAEAIHCVVHATKEVTQIRSAINSGERNRMWTVLQEFLTRYRLFIKAMSPVTSITIVPLSQDEIARMSTKDLTDQLRIVIGFVFAHHAILGASRVAFQQCFDKLTRRIQSNA